jgi:hypothetical protein
VADSDERRRILDMLAAGSISVDDAANLLKALTGGRTERAALPTSPKRGARLLRISIDAPDESGQGETTKVRVNVPIALARFATRLLPQEASSELKEQGIDLNEILSSLDEDLPDGNLIDIDAGSSDSAKGTTRIRIDVV